MCLFSSATLQLNVLCCRYCFMYHQTVFWGASFCSLLARYPDCPKKMLFHWLFHKVISGSSHTYLCFVENGYFIYNCHNQTELDRKFLIPPLKWKFRYIDLGLYELQVSIGVKQHTALVCSWNCISSKTDFSHLKWAPPKKKNNYPFKFRLWTPTSCITCLLNRQPSFVQRPSFQEYWY